MEKGAFCPVQSVHHLFILSTSETKTEVSRSGNLYLKCFAQHLWQSVQCLNENSPPLVNVFSIIKTTHTSHLKVHCRHFQHALFQTKDAVAQIPTVWFKSVCVSDSCMFEQFVQIQRKKKSRLEQMQRYHEAKLLKRAFVAWKVNQYQ